MNWTIEYGDGPAEEAVRTSGVASRKGFIRLNHELVANPRWRPGMTVLVDHTALDTSLLTGADVDAISDAVIELDDRFGPAAIAVVAADPFMRGLSEVSARYVAPSQPVFGSFSSHDQALQWLEAQKTRRLE